MDLRLYKLYLVLELQVYTNCQIYLCVYFTILILV